VDQIFFSKYALIAKIFLLSLHSILKFLACLIICTDSEDVWKQLERHSSERIGAVA
jgi:hypothetical protein